MESFIVKLPKLYTKVYNILDFGAKSDINFNNKKAIQEAIDCCSNNGGGLVLIPNGYYLSGPIQLKSNVNLHLDTNAYLQFTKSKEEYPLIFTEYEGQRRIRAISPIMATNCHDIAITGKGTISGTKEGNDDIVGSDSNDTIKVIAGENTVEARGGDDNHKTI